MCVAPIIACVPLLHRPSYSLLLIFNCRVGADFLSKGFLNESEGRGIYQIAQWNAPGGGRRRGARLTRFIRPPLLVDSRCRHPAKVLQLSNGIQQFSAQHFLIVIAENPCRMVTNRTLLLILRAYRYVLRATYYTSTPQQRSSPHFGEVRLRQYVP